MDGGGAYPSFADSDMNYGVGKRKKKRSGSKKSRRSSKRGRRSGSKRSTANKPRNAKGQFIKRRKSKSRSRSK